MAMRGLWLFGLVIFLVGCGSPESQRDDDRKMLMFYCLELGNEPSACSEMADRHYPESRR